MSVAEFLRLPEPTCGSGLDFSARMRALCGDMIARLPELAHIDLARVAVGFCQTRRRVAHGLQATLTPLRFAEGALVERRGRKQVTIQRVIDARGLEYLYLLNFYLPRFLDHPVREKLTTVVHELWHISPRFDGDLRRFPGRCFAHGASQRAYDAQVERLVDAWLAQGPDPRAYEFLQHDFRHLVARHGSVYGLKIPAPKLIVQAVAAGRSGNPSKTGRKGSATSG